MRTQLASLIVFACAACTTPGAQPEQPRNLQEAPTESADEDSWLNLTYTNGSPDPDGLTVGEEIRGLAALKNPFEHPRVLAALSQAQRNASTLGVVEWLIALQWNSSQVAWPPNAYVIDKDYYRKFYPLEEGIQVILGKRCTIASTWRPTADFIVFPYRMEWTRIDGVPVVAHSWILATTSTRGVIWAFTAGDSSLRLELIGVLGQSIVGQLQIPRRRMQIGIQGEPEYLDLVEEGGELAMTRETFTRQIELQSEWLEDAPQRRLERSRVRKLLLDHLREVVDGDDDL